MPATKKSLSNSKPDGSGGAGSTPKSSSDKTKEAFRKNKKNSPPVAFHFREFVEAKVLSFEWHEVKCIEETFTDKRREIPFLRIRLPKGVEVKIYGSHLKKESDWDNSLLVVKSHKVGLHFQRSGLAHLVPPNIDLLFRKIADDFEKLTFFPFGLICNRDFDLKGSQLNTTLQAARKDPDWVSVYRTVAAIKTCPESALMKTSLFHQLWEWLAPAIRKHDLSKFNDLISIMDAVKDSFPKKLEKYLVALISAYSDFDRPPTSTEIKLALNKQPEPRFRETASDQSQINRSLIELGLGWLIAKKKVKG